MQQPRAGRRRRHRYAGARGRLHLRPVGARLRPARHAGRRRAHRHRRHDRQGGPHQPRGQAAARQDTRHHRHVGRRRPVRARRREVGAVRQVGRRSLLRPEPPSRRHLRGRERLRRLRSSAGARHEAPRRAGKPPRRDHQGARRHRQAVLRRPRLDDLRRVGRAFRRPGVPRGRPDVFAALPAPAAAHRSPCVRSGIRRVHLAVRRRGRCRLRSEGRHRQAGSRLPAGCRNPRDPGRCGLVPGTRERISQAHAVRAGHRQ